MRTFTLAAPLSLAIAFLVGCNGVQTAPRPSTANARATGLKYQDACQRAQNEMEEFAAKVAAYDASPITTDSAQVHAFELLRISAGGSFDRLMIQKQFAKRIAGATITDPRQYSEALADIDRQFFEYGQTILKQVSERKALMQAVMGLSQASNQSQNRAPTPNAPLKSAD